MLLPRAWLVLAFLTLLPLACRFHESGISTERRDDSGAGGARSDGGGSLGDGGGDGAVDSPADLGGIEPGSPPDAVDSLPPGPVCAAGQRDCNGVCIAAGACCKDADCPAMPTGQLGKCDPTDHVCRYMCAADMKPCAGKCIPMGACCDDTGCLANFACVSNTCSTTVCRANFKRCGTDCIPVTTCCRADGCCDNKDCGLCQKCAAGVCVAQGGDEDLKNDCPNGACRPGTCNGAGACASSPDGQNGPMCAGECVRCRAGACEPRTGTCSTGQMCNAGKCPPRPPVAVRVNVNGPNHGLFAGDPGNGGVCGPSAFNTLRAINGTQEDALYQGEMFGAPAKCKVGNNLPAGMYLVNLHLAEIFWGPTCPGLGGGAGSRVFDIELEGKTVATNVDIFAEAGCAASLDGSGRPIVKKFTIAINDGSLDINLPAKVNNGKISAIEILSAW